jgi:acetyl-CoA C-acetyltransferase
MCSDPRGRSAEEVSSVGWNKVAIVGAGLIKFGELFEKSAEEMIQEAYLRAVSSVDKGFAPGDIQAAWLGVCRPGLHGRQTVGGASLVGIIGLAGIPCTHVENGCPTGSDTFRNACFGVASGVYDVVLALGYEKMRDSSTAGLLSLALEGHPVLERGETAMTQFAPLAVRHMHEFGTTKEQMALVAVKNRKNGSLDPYSHYQQTITLEEVLNSPLVCWPLNLFDCCPQTDGAAAVIICRADIATKYTDKPIYVAGLGMGTDYLFMHEKEHFTGYMATVRAARQAYAMAGLEPGDIDVAEVHDCFTITEIMNYEDLGFCDKGEGGRLIERGDTDIGGRIPVNPSGGLLTKGHPLGATGIAQIIELFWQLREEVKYSGGLGDPAVNEKRQVEIKRGYALQHNVGGRGISNSVVTILTRNP